MKRHIRNAHQEEDNGDCKCNCKCCLRRMQYDLDIVETEQSTEACKAHVY